MNSSLGQQPRFTLEQLDLLLQLRSNLQLLEGTGLSRPQTFQALHMMEEKNFYTITQPPSLPTAYNTSLLQPSFTVSTPTTENTTNTTRDTSHTTGNIVQPDTLPPDITYTGASKRKTRRPVRFRDDYTLTEEETTRRIDAMTAELDPTDTGISEQDDDGLEETPLRSDRPSLKELREIARLQNSTARSTHKSGHADDRTHQRGKKLRSGLDRKVHDKVVVEVEWAHMHVFEEEPATHASLTWYQFVSGELAIINDPRTERRERKARMTLLEDLLLHVGRALVTKVNKLNLRYLRKPQMSEKSVASDKTSAQRPKREVPCNKFQSGECTHKADHVTPSGLKVVHNGRCCLKWRPTLPADHPASKCKYKSKAEREALDADGAHNNPQALSLEARSPPAGLRTILDAPSQHGLRIVSPVLDAPAHTGLRVVSGASAHAAARTSPTMSAPAGSVNACRLHDIVLSVQSPGSPCPRTLISRHPGLAVGAS
ncbi:Hypp6541 [Branchiostoma lanceolatum]|uniref:Hypp6541 protein n=1 Tax=Branchiostoma lanceolatum TaxID=7740 RepID=A0A8J9YV46_BRALA|nr:Hypp6541 [Branchiostoma lanceolatum]